MKSQVFKNQIKNIKLILSSLLPMAYRRILKWVKYLVSKYGRKYELIRYTKLSKAERWIGHSKFSRKFIHPAYHLLYKTYRRYRPHFLPKKAVAIITLVAMLYNISLPFIDTLSQELLQIKFLKTIANYNSIKASASQNYLYEASNVDLKAYFGDKKFPKAHRFAINKNGSTFDLKLTEGESKCPLNQEGCNILVDSVKPITQAPVVDFESLKKSLGQRADLVRNFEQQLNELETSAKVNGGPLDDNVIRNADLVQTPGDEKDRVSFLRSENNRDTQIEYKIIDKGVSQQIILNQNTSPTVQFLLSLDGLQAIKTSSGTYMLLNPDRTTVIQVSKPTVRDFGGLNCNGTTCADIKIFQEPRGIILEIGVDQKWFADKNRSFPITVDTNFIISDTEDKLVKAVDKTLDNVSLVRNSPLKIVQGRSSDYLYEHTNTNFKVGFGSKIKGKSKLSFAIPEASESGVELQMINETPDVAVRKDTKLTNEETLSKEVEAFLPSELRSATGISSRSNLESKQTLTDSVNMERVKENVNLEYKVFNKGVKENLIITTPPPATPSASLASSTLPNFNPNKFEFAMNAYGVEPLFNKEKGVWEFFAKDDKSPLFHFASPFAEDSTGIRTEDVVIDVVSWDQCHKFLTSKDKSSCFRVIITVDYNWLVSPARVYPVFVDPTVVDDTQAEFDNGVKNRVVSSSTPDITTNYHELPADPYTLGLWHLNETSENTCSGGQDACDSSGNGYHGTATGTTINTTTQKLGAAARSFNGTSSDYITTGSISAASLTSGYSMVFWVKTSQSGTVYFLDWASYRYCWLNSGKIVCTVDGSNAGSATSSMNLNDGNWHHIAITSMSGSQVLYVDGRADATATETLNTANSGTFNIGKDNLNTTYLNGTLDEIAIFNRVLSAEEIKMDAQRAPYAIFTSPVMDLTTDLSALNTLSWSESGVNTGGGETLYSSTNLVAQWNFNETSGTTADNAEGTAALDGTLTNYTESTSNDCLDSQDDATPTGCADSHWTANDRRWGAGALTLDGSNDYVTVNDHANLNPSSAITVETWIKPAAWQASDTVIAKRNTSNVGGYLIQMGTSTNTIGFYVYSGGTWRGAYNGYFTPGEWTYVVGTYDGTNVKTYINGVLAGSTSYSGTINDDNGALRFGNYVLDGSQSYAGVIDSTRIYSRALGVAEIVSNYNAGDVEFQTRTSADNSTWEAWKPNTPGTNETLIDTLDGPYQYNTSDSGLVSYYPLDDTNASGGTTADVKGTNTGTLYGTRSVDGKFGKARKFNGSSDYIDVGTAIGNYASTDSFTVEAWVNAKTVNSANHGIIARINTSFVGWEIRITTGNALRFIIASSGSNYRGADTSAISANTWYHIVGVFNGSSATTYLNGIQNSTAVDAGTLGTTTASQSLLLGEDASLSTFFDGTLDEVRIYSTALSAATIQQKFIEGAKMAGLSNLNLSTDTSMVNIGATNPNNGSLKTQLGAPKVDANTVGLWHMDETQGNAKFPLDTNSTLTTNLLSYWGLNETTTGTAYDTFSTKNGTNTGTTVTSNAKQGYGRTFNGSTDKLDFGADFFPTAGSAYSDFSISLWIKPTSVAANQILLLQAPTTERVGDFALWLRSTNTIVFDRFDADTRADRGETATGVLQAGVWQHILVTWSGGDNGTRNIYINGNQMSLTNTNDTSTGNWGITNLTMGGGLASYWYNGTIDETGVWSKALAAQEITDLLNDHYADSTYQGATAYWKMDESSDGSAAVTRNDSVGSNNLTDNSPYSPSATAMRNDGVDFEADNSEFLSIGDNTDLSTGDIDFTITAWVKLESKTSYRPIMTRYGGTSTEYWLGYDQAQDRFRWIVYDTNGSNIGAVNATSLGSPSTATWYFITAWHDSVNNMVGIQVNDYSPTTVVTTGSPVDENQTTRIGGDGGATGYMDGIIDEVGFYKKILSPLERANLYQARANPYTMGGTYIKDARGGEFTTDNMGSLEQGMVGYWKLDESSAGSAAVTRYDPFGPNNLSDKNTVASTTGKVGTAATFAIASTEYLCSDNNFDGTCDDLNADLSTGAVDFTVSAWVNLTTKSGYRRIASKDDGATAEWVLYYDSSSDRFGFGTRNSNESVLDNNGPVSTSTWYYLVGWHDAANDLNCLQINNGTPNCAATAGNEPTDTAGPFYIGSLNPSRGATNNYMDGSIDEVVFWKRILSAQERMDLYNSGSGQTYSGGGGFHGSALGINVLPAVADGFTGKGRNFDGSNDYVSIGSLRNAGSAVKSVEFWTYPTSTTDYFVDLNGSAYVWANAGTVTATGFTTPTIYVNGAVSSTIVANKWQHVAVTTASGLNASAVNIGKTTTNYMAGKIDEVKISDVARTADEIAESYRAGRDHRITKTISSTDLSSQQKIPFYVASDRQGTFLEATIGEGAFQNNENDTNTRALWHLEEQTGTSPYLKDSSGLNNNLTVGSGTTFVQGKFGKARSFNGTSDYLTCTDANCGGTSKLDFPGTGGWSMGAWINTSQSGLGFIVSKDSDVASGRSWNLYINAGSPIYWVAKSGGTGTAVSSSTTLNDSKWHYVVGTYQYVGDGTSLLNLYIDGKLDLSATNAVGPILDGASSVQVGAREYSSSRGFFSGIIDEPFIAATQLSADQVRQAFEIGKRTHPVTIDFKANLLSTDLITGSSDLGFNVDSTAFGASNKGDNLYLGDKVIVKEKVDSTEYIAQGTVTSVNTSTGSVSVSAWDASSTFPTGGFTTNAILFKWQREYFDITGVPLSTQRDAITTITLRPTDTSQGANVWLDDLKSAGSYLTTSPATITSTLNRYIQYRAIFSSSDPAVSASLASITTDYDQGPTGSNMSKVMRHGKWFNSSGILRPYWWAK